MTDEGRRTEKMATVLSLIAGQKSAEVNSLLCYLCGRQVTSEQEPVVANMAKAWLYSQHPPFMECAYGENDVYEEWIGKCTKKLGDNVSLTPIPAGDLNELVVILDKMDAAKATIAEQEAKIAELEGSVAELEPFKGQAADLEKKVEGLEGKVADLEAAKAEQAAQIAEFSGKLPVAEDELNSTIKDIVTKALKDAVASVPMGGAAAAEGGEAVAEAAAEEPAGDAVPDTFGFGASGAGDDGFGF